jgi:hypothetical protein
MHSNLYSFALVIGTALVGSACDPSYAPAASPTSDKASTTAGGGATEAERQQVAERTARRDFGCDDPKVVVALTMAGPAGQVPFGESSSGRPRYLVEGCGKRGLYVENCTPIADRVNRDVDSPFGPAPTKYSCRYVLASVVPTHPAAVSEKSGGSAVTTLTSSVNADEDKADAGESADAAAGL